MYYIIGDIHGSLEKLEKLYRRVSGRIRDTDIVIFLGDYIDRGKSSFEVIEFLRSIASDNMVFLKGNHEAMLFDYIAGDVDHSLYVYNGGDATMRSYKKHTGASTPAKEHRSFFEGLIQYYEGDDFIAVHAGLRPYVGNLASQSEEDMLWIREKFYKADYRWDKTVVFGHTPTFYIHGRKGEVYDDEKRNIIGIDTGAVYGGKLTCLVWPEKTFIQVQLLPGVQLIWIYEQKKTMRTKHTHSCNIENRKCPETKIRRKPLTVFSICISAILALSLQTGGLYSGDYHITATVESIRADSMAYLIFQRKPLKSEYYIISDERIIGKVSLVTEEDMYPQGSSGFKVLAKYIIFRHRDRSLLRTGTVIGFSIEKGKIHRDFADKKKVVRVQYKKTILGKKDGRIGILVPEGKFVMGSNDGERDEYPEQIMSLPAFYIDKYEVSNKDFLRYVRQMNARYPVSWKGAVRNDDLPAVVNYYEAAAYAKWAGKRLPTEAEWEKAARGGGLEIEKQWDESFKMIKRTIAFPWGNHFDPSKVNCSDFWEADGAVSDYRKAYTKGLLPVTSLEGAGDSPYGVVNMAGNANEWTASWYRAYNGNTVSNALYGTQVKVVRGGNWLSSRNHVRVSDREPGGIPNLYHDSAGFRCVREPNILDKYN